MSKSPIFISIINQKGGVGKTTSATNISAFLSTHQIKTLLIDLDPQGNSTDTLCPNIDQDTLTGTYDFFLSQLGSKQPAFSDLIYKSTITKSQTSVDVMKANIRLSEIEISLANKMNREKVFSKSVEYYKDNFNQYDIVIIDCPPSLGLLTINCFLKSDYLLVPVDASAYSHKGLIELTNSLGNCNKIFNADIKFLGIFFAKFNRTEKIYQEAYSFLKDEIGTHLIEQTVSKSTKIEQATHANQTIIDYAPDSQAYTDYDILTQEILSRIELSNINQKETINELH